MWRGLGREGRRGRRRRQRCLRGGLPRSHGGGREFLGASRLRRDHRGRVSLATEARHGVDFLKNLTVLVQLFPALCNQFGYTMQGTCGVVFKKAGLHFETAVGRRSNASCHWRGWPPAVSPALITHYNAPAGCTSGFRECYPASSASAGHNVPPPYCRF